jgi:hypothetical protein
MNIYIYIYMFRLMDDFYKYVLKKSIDMSCVDVDAIGKSIQIHVTFIQKKFSSGNINQN